MIAPVMIVTRKELASLMARADYLAAVEEAFRADREGRAFSPLPMHIDGDGGVFHAKGAAFTGDGAYVAIKVNGNFPKNPDLHGLPTIQGAVLLCDARRGSLLAIVDSIEITLKRTAAASALAARYLASKNAHTLLVCGCGDQGRVQAEALSDVCVFERGYAFDHDRKRAAVLAEKMQRALGFRFKAVDDFSKVSRKSDVIVTCTTASDPFLTSAHVSPGTFIAAVGADSPYKSEISPDLMASAKIVVDVREQCAEMGDLRAALATGAISMSDVHAELGEVVTGEKPGRASDREIIIFDSTGTALQDVTSTAMAYERALQTKDYRSVALGAL